MTSIIKTLISNDWYTVFEIKSNNLFVEDLKCDIIVNFSIHKFDKFYIGIKMKFKDKQFAEVCKKHKDMYFYIPNSILYSHRQLVIPRTIIKQPILKFIISDDEKYYYLINYENVEKNEITIYLIEDETNKCVKTSVLTCNMSMDI